MKRKKRSDVFDVVCLSIARFSIKSDTITALCYRARARAKATTNHCSIDKSKPFKYYVVVCGSLKAQRIFFVFAAHVVVVALFISFALSVLIQIYFVALFARCHTIDD